MSSGSPTVRSVSILKCYFRILNTSVRGSQPRGAGCFGPLWPESGRILEVGTCFPWRLGDD